MEWMAHVDGYCERVGPHYWAEPINALTNLAFVFAAIIMWPRVRGLIFGRALVVILAAIGLGSYLFHTHAQIWSALADVLPIVVFILLYLFVAIFHFWNKSALLAGVGIVIFFPYAIGLSMLFNLLLFFHISAFYWPVPILIFGFAVSLRNRANQTSRGLAIGAGLLCLSLVARSIDETFCSSIPFGTHFLRHILNGVMLGWMIEVYRRHMLAGAATGR